MSITSNHKIMVASQYKTFVLENRKGLRKNPPIPTPDNVLLTYFRG